MSLLCCVLLAACGSPVVSSPMPHGGQYQPPPTIPGSRGGTANPGSGSRGGRYGGPGDVTPPTIGGRGAPTTPGPAGPASSGPSTPGPGAPTAPPPGPATGGPTGPTTPGPAGAGPRGPATGARMTLEPDHTEWDYWWEYNRHRFLRLKEAIYAVPVQTGSDEFFMGPSRRVQARDTLEPTDIDRLGQVLPALHQAVAGSQQRDIVSACLVALAKVGLEHPDHPLLPALRAHLPSHDQEIRETAALCLGISRRPEALDDLLALLADDSRGRVLCQRSNVDDRTRTFAAYGLGVLAAKADRDLRQRVAAALVPILQSPDRASRNLKVAAIHSLSRLSRPDSSPDRLPEMILSGLETYYLAPLGVGEQWLQAHVPTAAARLLGRTGPEYLRRRWLDLLTADLAGANDRRNPALAQSAALALGLLAPPHEGDASPGARYGELLARMHGAHRDAQTRAFCLIGLAQAGGAGNRALLLRAFENGNQALERPWAALALGVLARRQLDLDPTRADATIGTALVAALAREKNPATLGALALALGLCQHRPAIDDLRSLLREHAHQDVLAGHLCIALALLGDRGAVSELNGLLRSSIRRPSLLRQTAAALGVLGDRTIAPQLIDLLESGDTNVARTAAVAMALGQIGDRRTIEPLCSLLLDDSLTSQARAFAAVALGDVADHGWLPWNEPLARNINYRAAVETLLDGQLGVLDIL